MPSTSSAARWPRPGPPGIRVVVVTSGAIAAGWTSLAPDRPRPDDLATLQAVAAVGQHRLMQVWSDALERQGLTAGQVLLAPLDFVHRSQYLHARQTLSRLLDLGVVPVVNENDAVADEEIRFGDNDRLAALVAHLVGAELLVLLTDTAGLLTEDPRRTDGGSLIEEVVEIDHELERIAGGPGSAVGQRRDGLEAGRGQDGRVVGRGGGHRRCLPARGAGRGDRVRRPGWGPGSGPGSGACRPASCGSPSPSAPAGTIVVDAGARRALVDTGRSLLPAGVVVGRGATSASTTRWRSPVPTVRVFAKGLVRQDSATVAGWAGRRSDELPEDASHEVVHRDDLVVLD